MPWKKTPTVDQRLADITEKLLTIILNQEIIMAGLQDIANSEATLEATLTDLGGKITAAQARENDLLQQLAGVLTTDPAQAQALVDRLTAMNTEVAGYGTTLQTMASSGATPTG